MILQQLSVWASSAYTAAIVLYKCKGVMRSRYLIKKTSNNHNILISSSLSLTASPSQVSCTRSSLDGNRNQTPRGWTLLQHSLPYFKSRVVLISWDPGAARVSSSCAQHGILEQRGYPAHGIICTIRRIWRVFRGRMSSWKVRTQR